MLTEAGHRRLIKPAVLQKAITGGFAPDDFRIDTAAGTVTCPDGHTTVLLPPGGKHRQRKAWFTAKQCTNCPLRSRCTIAKGDRVVTWRAAVERTIAWLVNRGNRHLPCRGTINGERWIHHRAAALNHHRLINLGLHHHDGTWTLAPASP
ncbi:transposase [Streptomyces sp. NPDC021100]|uniref:transposase n=1 Tax=Streptomyces sp. NPDC021100 TaxID=3365114 RepID=UPI0037AB7085